jgi:hypothetical protein
MNSTPEIELEDREATRKDIEEFRTVLSTIKSASEDKAAEREELFQKQVGLLIKAKQKAGWTSRRISRYIKRNLNLNINFK